MKAHCFVFLALTLSFSSGTLANTKFEAIVTNSPVKETFLKVELTGVSSVSEVFFKPKNGGAESKGEVVQENGKLFGNYRVSHLKPGTYEYRVMVRSSSGQSAQRNSADVGFVTFTIDPLMAVADPGEEGKKTLAGIDSDNDGIRDDVQRWVLENYLNKPSTKSALFQMAVDFQNLILFSGDRNKIRNEIAPQFSRSSSCLSWVSDDYERHIRSLSAKVNNTEMRVKARLVADANLGGYSPPREVTETRWIYKNKFCKFSASQE